MAGAAVGLAAISEETLIAWPQSSSSATTATKSDPTSSPKSDPWTSGAMGLASTSLAVRLGGYNHPAGPLRNDSIAFLEYCHSIGSAGVQTSVKGDLAAFRKRAEELDMFVEYESRLPDHADDDMSAFEKSLSDANAVGASCLRVVSLSGRRYENFKTMDAYLDWKKRTTAVTEKIVPLAEKQKVILAMENHKDRTADEFVALLKQISSEYYGALIDFGNNISLAEEPMSVVAKLAPYAKSTHLKDMAVQPYDEGFLLAEVVCGEGFLDVKGMVELCRRANPKVHLLLEMITDHTLKVPVKTDEYWATFPERRATALAAIMQLVDQHSSQEMPQTDKLSHEQLLALEEDSNRRCLEWARQNLAVSWLA
jgi:sugar phosphate isomerase/epimerase